MNFERFYFTQQSLKAFESCPLKFKKRYIENIYWGEPPEENVRRHVQLGKDFHLLAQRYFMGIPMEDAGAALQSEQLEKWYNSLKRSFPLDKDTVYLPECKLKLNSGRGCLEANFDLLAIKDGQITIWDWKTGSSQNNAENSPRNRKLRGSLQTMVYLFVLKELGYLITGEKMDCENLRMCYWQPEPAAVITEVIYSDDLHEAFFATLFDRIEVIRQYDYSTFDKSLYGRSCKYCEFNCFCNSEKVDYEAVYTEDFLDTDL